MAIGGRRAGLMNRKLEFYAPSTSTDHTGQQIDSYALAFSVLGKVEPLRGAEAARFHRIESAALIYSFTIHYTPRLTIRHRVKYNGQFFDIQSFAADGNMNRRFISFVGEALEASDIVID